MEVICALVFASWLVCQADLLEESLPQRPHHIRWQVVHDPDEHFSKALNDVWAVNSLHHHLQHHRYALSLNNQHTHKHMVCNFASSFLQNMLIVDYIV